MCSGSERAPTLLPVPCPPRAPQAQSVAALEHRIRASVAAAIVAKAGAATAYVQQLAPTTAAAARREAAVATNALCAHDPEAADAAGAIPALVKLLRDNDPVCKRCAAESLTPASSRAR